MIDSSSWTIPESESGGCQLGILEDFLEAKNKMHPPDSDPGSVQDVESIIKLHNDAKTRYSRLKSYNHQKAPYLLDTPGYK